ncbi:MAG: tRNA pseudouridine(55) synthase TruB [Saprospiraceae bacterium]|nr:tRNA pseudouridine(55) synthase TruB [Candidatus Defluviibacterium haderslevense]
MNYPILTLENLNQIDFHEGTVILVDKPYERTSFFVVDKLRRAIQTRTHIKPKIGHAGTLDPLATGLLILCTGKMTKKISDFQDFEKTYSGTFTLGATTPSFDRETPINQEFNIDLIDQSLIESIRLSFLGPQELIPPTHSAVKVDGRRAYKLARKGEQMELKPRNIIIHSIDINADLFPIIQFKVQCSKGTYIRSIAHEFGKRLGSGAYLSSLSRDQIGPYSLSKAWHFDGLKELLYQTDHE